MADQWLSIVEYARCFHLSDMTVRRRIKTGKLHAVLREGKYYIPVAGEQRGHPTQTKAHFITEDTPARHSHQQRRHEPAFDEPSVAHESFERQASGDYRETRGGIHYPKNRNFHHYQQSNSQPHMRQNRRFFQAPPPQFDRPPPKSTPLLSAEGKIPQDLRQSLLADKELLIESQELLDFCEGVLKKFEEAEKIRLTEFKQAFQALEEKTKDLESKLHAKDITILELKQKVEDLQLLVQLIEQAQSPSPVKSGLGKP